PGAGPAAGGRQRSWLRGGGAVDNVQTFRSPTALLIWIVWLLFAAANWVDLAVQGRDHTSVVAAAVLLVVTGVAYVAAQRPRIIADDAGVTIKNPLRDHRIGWAGVSKVDLVDLLRVHCDRDPGAASGNKRTKVISSWAVHYSRRRQLAAEVRTRRVSRPRRSSFGLPYDGDRGAPFGGRAAGYGGGRGAGYGGMLTGPAPAAPASEPEADAEMAVRLLSERATAARAETVWATGTVDIAGPPPTEATRPTEVAPRTEAAPPSQPAAPAVAGWLEPLTSSWSNSAIAAVLVPVLILLIVYLL
ncbi:MAG: PH domain-containing protein, partial [Actinomycetota bacterium]|nr:PH domain-containing protein [Actinomycetota bacterium]